MSGAELGIFRAIYGGFRSPVADVFFALLSTSALGWLAFVLAIPFLPFKAWRNGALRHMAAVLLALCAPSFKVFFEHDRPSKMLWVHEQETVYGGSFPSGHTTVAFLIAVNWSLVLGRRGQGRWVPLLILWAVLVGVSRIYRGVHWPTDVLGGACLGSALALALDFAWPRPKAEREPQAGQPIEP